jgi:4-amino-4-deoxy-L-arabinose transferase-like glycosyltransferase
VSMLLADPLGPPADKDQGSSHARPRRRWEVWRSPDDQPRWARPALLGIAAAAALLYAWNIAQAGYAPFYSVAVKSMSESWKAFFYGAFDPSATITIDKLAGSFLPQALSARVFGFHAWSLALPQVIEGVVSVLVMYQVVRRWAGVPAGLIAAGIFTLTPVAASMFGHSMEDGALTMCLVLAADAYQRAVTEARLRSLVMAGVWVGLGFNAKMLQAWIVLPALAIGYLFAAPVRLRKRAWHAGVAGLVMLAVSLAWIALYTFTPASDRPYVDGSTNNSAIASVFGYNGLERFGIAVKGAVTSGPGVTTGRGTGGTGTRSAGGFSGAGGQAPGGGFPGGGAPGNATSGGTGGTGTGTSGARGTTGQGQAPGFARGGAPGGGGFGSGWTKLLGSQYGPEIGWLYPLAALAFVFGLLWTRRAKRTDKVRAGFVFWGAWALTYVLVFSKMSTIPHTAYMSSLAPALAALPAAGIVMFWRAYRAGGWRAWVLPAAIAAELAWALFLWHYYPGFLPWARDLMLVAGAAAVAVLVAARLSRRIRGRVVALGLAVGVAAMIAAPAAWAASVLDTRYGGSSFNASAGPAGGFGGGGIAASATTTLTQSEREIYDYVSAHRDGASYLMAVDSWETAGRYILATGQEVINMGGFSGSVPSPTLAQVKELVSTGQLRFFLIGGSGGGFGGAGGASSTSSAIESWVQSACPAVPARYSGSAGAGGSSSAGAGGGSAFGGTQAGGTLYVCGKNA